MCLKEALTQINWTNKLEIYEQYFEYVKYLGDIQNPLFSVVIISYRLHPDTLINLRELNQQKQSQSFEIIFVDNGGEIDEFDALKPYIDTYIRLNQNTGAYLARNVGATFSKAPYLIFLEDDGIPDCELIKAYKELIQAYEVISIRGVYLAKTDNPLNARQTVYYLGNNHFPAYVNLEGNALFLAKSFFQVGGWDDQIRYGHGGMELAVRLLKIEPDKRKQIYSPLPIIYHDLVKDEQEFLVKRRKHELAYLYLKEKHPDIDQFIRDWQSMFLSDTELSSKSLGDLDTLMQQIYQRNQRAIHYMNQLFIPSYDSEQIRRLLPRLMHNRENLFIFGAGSLGEHVLNVLNKNDIVVAGFLDNNSAKWNNKIKQYSIFNPNRITNRDFIVIASIYSYEIRIQLEQMGLKNNQDFIIIH
ncbi:glycosyltransferase involved in cell wall biosynthesis [Natronobacillus azotifigens]|uniref:Glycosyltransferase n=1 Tax=Natronobacillus azotifigens TaxID=472978 RepID=A0A9J6RA18_9BACI|nr:glycosyltransferase [Natronobacillus azotifigens]MCZ0702105.1 glycosyltransferase [Natronobacillus azotifigens]